MVTRGEIWEEKQEGQIWRWGLTYTHCAVLSHFSRVQLVATTWTIQPARLFRPQDSPGKNTELGCHFLLYIYTLLYRTQTTNKDLLYSTENSTQYYTDLYENRNTRRQSGCMRSLHKQLRKEEKQKARVKGKHTPN